MGGGVAGQKQRHIRKTTIYKRYMLNINTLSSEKNNLFQKTEDRTKKINKSNNNGKTQNELTFFFSTIAKKRGKTLKPIVKVVLVR